MQIISSSNKTLCFKTKKHKNGLNFNATQMILRMRPGMKAHTSPVTESPSSLVNRLQTVRCNVV